jgi:hypothetical protein
MAMYCLNMLTIALELARENPVYEDMATKFFEHFIYIADAMNPSGHDKTQLWDDEDGFFYDVLHFPNGHRAEPQGAIDGGADSPVCRDDPGPGAAGTGARLYRTAGLVHHNRPDLKKNVACMETEG